MPKKKFFLALLLSCLFLTAFTQADTAVYFKGAIKENRNILHRNIIQHTIIKGLSLPLSEDAEGDWEDAFGAMELLRYKSPWADGRVNTAFDSIKKRSPEFQRALLELAYTNYPERFFKEVTVLFNNSADAKVSAMAAEYLLLTNKNAVTSIDLANRKQRLIKNEKDEAIIRQLLTRIQRQTGQKNNPVPLAAVVHDLLKNQTVLFSFQRKNRDYPGIAVIRDSSGNFVKEESGAIFSVPQLARSINNLPGYLTNGNTPQGIFRMYGFDTSKTYFIGPTTNIQLTMPFETSLPHFLNDSTITDTAWSEEWYKKLLPAQLKNYTPLYESFYAGKAGRTEIIAHGTTVDPTYYTGEFFYPQTPTMGCLCTKEIWSEANGKRLESDQQKLAAALLKAGGANGYCVVIEIDDAQRPVVIDDILPFLNPAKK